MTSPLTPDKHGVHARHCCRVHGCSYGYSESDCPVASGRVHMDDPLQCDICQFVAEHLADIVARVPSQLTLQICTENSEVWTMNTEIGVAEICFTRGMPPHLDAAFYTADVLNWIVAKTQYEFMRDPAQLNFLTPRIEL